MAKRVNKSFLIGVIAVVGVVFAILFGVYFFGVFRKDPAATARAGDALLKEGKAKEAAEKYKYALANRPNDKEILVKLGDAYNAMVVEDTQNLGNARAVWHHITAADPQYKPALERLLDSYWQQMESSMLEGELYTRVRETAQRLSDVEPANLSVLAKVHIATVRPWLDGLTQVFRTEDVNASRKALDALMQRDRANADIPYYLALCNLKEAQELRRPGREDKEKAERLTAEAGKKIDQAAADQPKNAALQLRAAQVYTMLEQVERARAASARRDAPRSGAPLPEIPAEGQTPSGKKAKQALAAAVEAAQSLKPEDPLFADIQVAAADAAIADHRPEDAEKIYAALLKKLPDDQNVRIHYAAVLARAGTAEKRDRAIQLLSAEVNVKQFTGARGFLAAQLRAKTLIDLVDARIEKARLQEDPDKRKAELATAKEDLDRLGRIISTDSIPVLRLRGRLQQMEGNPIASIQTFQRAVDLMQGSTKKDFTLVNDLANAYIYAGQTGSAKKLLQDVIDRNDWFVPARLQMAQVLITENKLDDARTQLDQADKYLGAMQGQADMKELPAWQANYQRVLMSLLARSKDPKLDEQFTRMAEGTRGERLNKAAVAQGLKKYDEAARLANLVLAENPKDLGALEALLNANISAGHRAEALAAVDRTLAANPPEAQARKLKEAREKIAAQMALEKASPEQAYAVSRKLVEEEPDTPERAVKLADLELRFKHPPADAEAILLKANAANPASVPVLSRLFELAISQKQWDKARAYCDKLVATKGDGADGLLYQFRFATAHGDKAEALRIAKAVKDSRPEFDLGYLAMGQALQAMERYGDAVNWYNQARIRKPLNFDALKGMVECFYAQNMVPDAKRLIDEARGLFPDNPHFKDLELNHELVYGDPQSVVAEREEILRQQPEDRQNWVELASAYRVVARAKREQDPARSAEALAKARDLLTRGLAKWKGDTDLTASLAAVLSESGDFAGGEKLLGDYARAPEHAAEAQPLLVLADYYIRGNQYEKAEAASREALQRAEGATPPDLKTAADIRVRLADFLSRFGRFDDALAAIDQAKTGEGSQAAELNRVLFRQRLQVLVASGRRDLAEHALLEALAKPSLANDPDLQMKLVTVNFEGGKYDEALDRVNKILKAEPDNTLVRFFRGQILLKKPRPDLAAAIDDLNFVKGREPNKAGARLLLADAYRKQRDNGSAVRVLEEGLRLQPTDRDLRLKLMDVRSDPNGPELDEVLRLAREARENLQLKDDPVWAYREALVHAQRNKWGEAVAAINDAIKLDPRDVNLRREQQNILLGAGRYQDVLAMTDAMARDGRAPYWVFMNRGRARHGLKDDAGATSEFNAGLNAAADNSAAVEQIVKTMVATVGKDEALNQVLARAGKDVRWKLLAAALYSVPERDKGKPADWERAVAMLDEVQAHFSELSPAHKAQALRIAGPLYQLAQPPQYDKARKAYLDLLAPDVAPNDLFALNNLANLLIDESLVPQPQEARKYSQAANDQVKRAQPFPAAIFDTHGWVLVQCGELTEAIEILQKVTSQTNMPEAHYHLGEAYLKKQDYNKAKEELRIASQAVTEAISQGNVVPAGLEKKIQAALQKAGEVERAARGGEATAQ
jgi:tetratricopeptide (TPR) repeat protein